MEQTPVRSPRRTPALVLLAAAVGLLAAAASLWWAFILIAFGGLISGGMGLVLSLAQLAAGVLGGWGAVRLLRGRGWMLLALGCVLGLRPFLAMVGEWSVYGPSDVFYAVLGTLPPVALALVLPPPVRRWSTRPAAPHLTTSGA